MIPFIGASLLACFYLLKAAACVQQCSFNTSERIDLGSCFPQDAPDLLGSRMTWWPRRSQAGTVRVCEPRDRRASPAAPLHVRGTVARAHPRPGMNLAPTRSRERSGVPPWHAHPWASNASQPLRANHPCRAQCEPTTASRQLRADACEMTTLDCEPSSRPL